MLASPLIYLYNTFLSAIGPSSGSSSNSTILQFDDLNTTKGLGPLPSIYNHLSFHSYSVLKPRDPALENLITPNDLNCAVSAPNALLGSRTGNGARVPSGSSHMSSRDPTAAYFHVGNATAMVESGLQPYFSLISLNLKPLDAPWPGTTMFVKGYSATRNESSPLEWHVDFPVGYHQPLKAKMAEYSGEEWNELYGVEITADFGEDALDWEFCIDDLEIMFFQKSQDREVGFVSGHEQNVLKDE